MSNLVVIQSSLNKNSKTAVIVDHALEILFNKGVEHKVIDLRNIKLEFCDGRKIEEYNNDLQNAYELMKSASAYIIGMPVYCYSVSGVLKNFLDITCSSMKGKFAGIICNAGGIMSYLASADLIKILSYEVHVLTVQPTVYACDSDFQNGKIANQKVINKAKDMIENLMSLV